MTTTTIRRSVHEVREYKETREVLKPPENRIAPQQPSMKQKMPPQQYDMPPIEFQQRRDDTLSFAEYQKPKTIKKMTIQYDDDENDQYSQAYYEQSNDGGATFEDESLPEYAKQFRPQAPQTPVVYRPIVTPQQIMQRIKTPVIGLASQESLAIRTGKPDWQPHILAAKPKTMTMARQMPETIEFHDFNTQQLSIINGALRSDVAASDEIISKFKLSVRRADIQTLSDRQWLNDAVINFYMQLLIERSKQKTHLPRLYVFDSFFWPKLDSFDYTAVAHWTKHVDIFAYDLVAVPVHANGDHWCVCMIDFKNHSIQLYDSLAKASMERVLEQMKEYLIEERKNKRKDTFDLRDWKLQAMSDVPQQENTSDCGVFCCAFVEALSRGAPIRFGQENIPWIRQKMVLEICTGKMLL